jgi:hypothetical protein
VTQIPACCPIELEESAQTEAIPSDGAQHGEEADEAVRPVVQEGQEAQEHIQQ